MNIQGNVEGIKMQKPGKTGFFKYGVPKGIIPHIHVLHPSGRSSTVQICSRQIYSGHPARRPLGQHCETMLFKIIPDDFVSNEGSNPNPYKPK